MKALILDASGFVGRALVKVLSSNDWQVAAASYDQAVPDLDRRDLTQAAAVRDLVAEAAPDVVVLIVEGAAGGAAGKETLVQGATTLAEAAARHGARLVLCTVRDPAGGQLDGDGRGIEAAEFDALRADLEALARGRGDNHLIVRSELTYGWDRSSDNIVQRVERRLATGTSIRLPGNVLVRPTLVDYLAEVMLRLIQEDIRGTVAVTGKDRLSVHDFGRRLARSMALDEGLVMADPGPAQADPAVAPAGAGASGDEAGITVRLDDLLGTEPMPLDESLKRLRRQWRADTHVVGAAQAPSAEADRLKQEIFDRVRQYYELVHTPKPFVPYTSRVNYAGRYFDADEMLNLADSMLDFWLTLGPYGDLFEAKMKRLFGARDFALVNSGSSANLTAVAALCSPLLDGGLRPGDEVITPAVTFPTTLAPLLQNGLVPVFVDCELGTYNIDLTRVESAISPKTRALVIPHTLGNPFDLDIAVELAKRHNLFLLEDTCDALGSEWDGRLVGTLGDLGTLSFYPAHHLTMGEGGGVIVNRARLAKVVKSVRDWGRDCWCAPGESNTCGKRFGWCLGGLPRGYDHKYIYTGLGYNLKPTDMQAAIGVAQLEKLPHIVERRRHNFARLHAGLQPYQDWLLLPTWHPKAKPSWFGFPITVQGGVSRHELVHWLESANIETREVFGGNILRQPGYQDIPRRVVGELDNSDRVMDDTFFIGVYPGITDEMVDFMIERFDAFFQRQFK